MIDLILNPQFVALAFVLLAVGTPAGGAIALTVTSKPKRERLKRFPFFYLLVASGPLLALMWVVFNFIENLLGLDSILAFLINLCLFCSVGLGIGAALRFSPRMLRKERAAGSGAESAAEAPAGKGKENAYPSGTDNKSSKKRKK